MFYFPTATVQYPSAGARGFVLLAALGQFGCMDSLHRISPALRRGRSRSDSRVFPRYSQISECEASGAALPGGGNGEITPSPCSWRTQQEAAEWVDLVLQQEEGEARLTRRTPRPR